MKTTLTTAVGILALVLSTSALAWGRTTATGTTFPGGTMTFSSGVAVSTTGTASVGGSATSSTVDGVSTGTAVGTFYDGNLQDTQYYPTYTTTGGVGAAATLGYPSLSR